MIIDNYLNVEHMASVLHRYAQGLYVGSQDSKAIERITSNHNTVL